ncbi:MAG: hypothetical protein UY21_C0012G0008 [Microgenomates group bacterium GW2011_GWA1_48_10]|uniref:Uncharacterized protein n=1 Tax=Candidatus Gottesmanbacteria bacterium RIFCSPHIGHO2_01_FULL_47_48 TaxID=1798381 RepID=A0A1F6A4K4_9BACT|nr:MAG: hypothetical protein UY21_C0012G0008 [Microgenomates group bacterium GW2011_GWA1_48_10]OGG19660.1 MAG: hypothetical protein A2721_00910 [Candidatus Gottesmanbacteria bacterium RIFCSPHIGHO2_01_FULL_47_48]
MFDLKHLALRLEKEGFDTSMTDAVLAASEERSGSSVEITIDSAGGCLVKRTQQISSTPSRASLLRQDILVISKNSKLLQFRVRLTSVKDLEELLKFIESLPNVTKPYS